MLNGSTSHEVATVRSFNRFYTRQIGVLQEGLLRSPFSLTEVRVLYELAHRDGLTAASLCAELGIDPGYLSRTLRAFEKRRLIARKPSKSDGRESLLMLTDRGRQVFAPLEDRSNQQVAGTLQRLSRNQRKELLLAMCAIKSLLGTEAHQDKGKDPICFVLTCPAIWVGSCTVMVLCTHKNMAMTNASRRWWRRSLPSSSRSLIRRGNGAGFPRKMARSSGPFSSYENPRRWPNFASYSWNPRPVASASPGDWSGSACALPDGRGTRRSCSGRRVNLKRHVTCIIKRDSRL